MCLPYLVRLLCPLRPSQVPYTITKQCVFDFLCAVAYGMALFNRLPGLAISLGAAVLTSCLSCFASQPGDVLLTAVYKDSDHDSHLKDIWTSSGLRGFFVGTKARLIHVGLICTIQLVVYDMLRVALGLRSVGL